MEIATEKKKGVRLKKSFCLKAKTFQKRLDNKNNVYDIIIIEREVIKMLRIKEEDFNVLHKNAIEVLNTNRQNQEIDNFDLAFEILANALSEIGIDYYEDDE